MPMYEYRCGACRCRSTMLYQTWAAAAEAQPTCPHCGSSAMERLISRFFSPRSEDDRLDALADPASFGDVDENDPRSVARWARRMSKELGEDLGPEYEQMIDDLESGKLPEGEGDDGLGMPAGVGEDTDTGESNSGLDDL